MDGHRRTRTEKRIIELLLRDARQSFGKLRMKQGVRYVMMEAVPGLEKRMPEAKPAKGKPAEIVEEVKQGVVLVVCY